jgi:hypothetical protein
MEVVAAALLLTGNFLVLRWLVVSEPAGESKARPAAESRPEPTRLRRAA